MGTPPSEAFDFTELRTAVQIRILQPNSNLEVWHSFFLEQLIQGLNPFFFSTQCLIARQTDNLWRNHPRMFGEASQLLYHFAFYEFHHHDRACERQVLWGNALLPCRPAVFMGSILGKHWVWWFILHTEILQSPLLQCFAHRNCHSCVGNWITVLQFNVLPCACWRFKRSLENAFQCFGSNRCGSKSRRLIPKAVIQNHNSKAI